MSTSVNEVFVANEQSPQKFQLNAEKFEAYCKENWVKTENIAELKKNLQDYFMGYNNLSWDRFRKFSNNLGEYITSKVSETKNSLATSSVALRWTNIQASSMDTTKSTIAPSKKDDFQNGIDTLVDMKKIGWRGAQLDSQITAYTRN